MMTQPQNPFVASHPSDLADEQLDVVAGGLTKASPKTIAWSGPGDEGPEESITFVYGK
jgi:hypothetical protein